MQYLDIYIQIREFGYERTLDFIQIVHKRPASKYGITMKWTNVYLT